MIVMRGKSRRGDLYFYYLCRGRQDHECDLPYVAVAKVEQAVRDHYATVQLTDEYRQRIKAAIREAAASKRATGVQMRQQLQKRLEDLGHREDRYLDLYGEGNLPKDKLSERLSTIHSERDNLRRQLEQMQGELDTGRAILTSAVDLLDRPQAIYDEAKTPARQVLNKAIFTKLYVEADEAGVRIADDELTEPFSTVVYARRADGGVANSSELRRAVQEALSAREATGKAAKGRKANSGLLPETAADGLFLAGLLGRSLVGAGSSKTAMVPPAVPPAGFEPAPPPPEGGALSPELRGLSDHGRIAGWPVRRRPGIPPRVANASVTPRRGHNWAWGTKLPAPAAAAASRWRRTNRP